METRPFLDTQNLFNEFSNCITAKDLLNDSRIEIMFYHLLYEEVRIGKEKSNSSKALDLIKEHRPELSVKVATMIKEALS